MSGNGAYEGEMNHVALFESALRAAVTTRPDPAIGTGLVPRLAEIARAATIEAETLRARRAPTAPRSRFALVARVGIAVALIPLVSRRARLCRRDRSRRRLGPPSSRSGSRFRTSPPSTPGARQRPRQGPARERHGDQRDHGHHHDREEQGQVRRGPSARPRAARQGARQGRWATRRARRSGSTARPLRGRPSRRRRAPLLTATPGETRRRTPRRTPSAAHDARHPGQQRQRQRERAREVAAR